ncbi:MAG: hypothetical protein LBG50_03015, partial [Clostridiales Family XIII bacterium]|nr:hypothetical protein [Clostridiales Family XIII bacterium]
MRQRKIKDIEKKIEAFSEPLVYLPASNRGRWREVFGAGGADGEDAFAASGAGRPLFLEIGCGKGRFISDSALGHPEFLYLGFEGHQSVLYRALQRVYAGPDAKPTELNEIAMALVGLCSDGSENAHGAGAVEKNPMLPPNLRLCAEYIEDMTDLFAPGELNGIFLNFSDPWPKARQEKRRLTS